MSLSSDSDDMLMLNNGEDSSTFDDANSGRNMGRHSALKKGPWTSVEDAILVEYVTKHGEGNWNAVQKHSGLSRCGKSCRLRWANHLRPDLKKGAFTPEEERRIIELHAKMGNKWARMAAELPGRTDNEIKNYWNTRIKRRQRAGLPIYPPDVCIQAYNENQNDDMNPYSSGDMRHSDFIPVRFEIPAFKFKNSEPNQHMFPPPSLNMSVSSLLDTRPSSFLSQSLHPSYPNSCLVAGAKRFRGSESSVPGLSAETFMFSAAYGSNSTSNHASSSTALLSGSHATLNGNPSSSEPPWAPKHPELPSLQNQTGRWCVSPSSPLPPLESVDTFRTPPTGNNHSHNFSQRNSGLLDAVLYESQSLRNLDSNSGPKFSSARDVVVNNTSQDPYAVEWEAYSESIPPLCQSTSIFSDRAPVSGNLMDELQSAHHTKGCKVQYESSLGSIHHHNYAELQNHMSFHRPDLLLDSSCYIPQDTIGSLVDDLNRDCMSTI